MSALYNLGRLVGKNFIKNLNKTPNKNLGGKIQKKKIIQQEKTIIKKQGDDFKPPITFGNKK